ncbi:DUF7126 family protein [Halocalculus aciditolerans]|uniref:CTP synthetase n=1 Tax=Halocalculus aciditolerans TaxID=1383812 RepID=A0A830F1C4_9EURY|nr:CTP synthetase [Halocalculus aciditolerans]GGL51910.1 hypothetical protein GCM10009039_07680 [Halocalculus aciditolerans]
MKAVIVGPDEGLGDALAAAGVDVERIEGIGSGDALEAAGIADADLLVVTNVGEATAVSVALEKNPDLTTVVYSTDTVPEFVRARLDFAIDPNLLDPETVAEELTREA